MDEHMPFRYVVEIKPRGRGNHPWQAVAVCAHEADADYLASAYEHMDAVRARTTDLEEHP